MPRPYPMRREAIDGPPRIVVVALALFAAGWVGASLVAGIPRVPSRPVAAEPGWQVLPSPPAGARPRFCASRAGASFHRLECPVIRRVPATRIVWFAAREPAMVGRRPCRACAP